MNQYIYLLLTIGVFAQHPLSHNVLNDKIRKEDHNKGKQN